MQQRVHLGRADGVSGGFGAAAFALEELGVIGHEAASMAAYWQSPSAHATIGSPPTEWSTWPCGWSPLPSQQAPKRRQVTLPDRGDRRSMGCPQYGQAAPLTFCQRSASSIAASWQMARDHRSRIRAASSAALAVMALPRFSMARMAW